jgi:hypothetical protein
VAIQKVNEYKEITFSYSSNGEATTPGASTQFRLFSGHVKLRLIGIYLDGSTSPQGEVWFTQPIAVGA